MSKTTKHVYEVTEINGDFPNVEVGGHLVADNHVRKHHEPYRDWQFLDLNAKVNSGDGFKSIVGKHIGEYEKVKHLLAQRGEGATMNDREAIVEVNKKTRVYAVQDNGVVLDLAARLEAALEREEHYRHWAELMASAAYNSGVHRRGQLGEVLSRYWEEVSDD